ncbi:response regulator [Gloeothece verrucosa]|uniref:Response regulator receiver modulated diguanylate cyclase n=1 Tax=Gloeothece verrucosa (strain PCC 7822) TaxID=497965 RepID=E0UIS6_GLOV7|nr:response regulator [Gloeothece verrucosa]ADN13385.1 response regulator receiver modulated diguanylate cyclase [Gloeothece verrucosa PCC 7822]
MKILVVEDDKFTIEFLQTTLTVSGYTVDLASDGESGLELATLWNYDLILLDLQLPKVDGIKICRQLRALKNTTPILILTVESENNKIIQGLDAGADDYLIKPCDPKYLIAKIRSLVRRSSGYDSLLSWGDLCLDPVSTQVTYQQQPLVLRRQEYKLLKLFLRNPHRVFSRSNILDLLWSAEDFPSENAVTNLIKDLRNKLKDSGMTEDCIETLYGLGYRLKARPDKLLSKNQAARDNKCEKNLETCEGLALINEMAQRFRLSLSERISLLEEAVQELAAPSEVTTLTAKPEQAKEEAHRLAGSLGTYGYIKGSELARSIEQLLARGLSLNKTQITQLKELLTQLRQETNTPVNFPITNLETVETIPRLWAINLSPALATALQQEASQWEIQVEVVQDCTTAQDLLNKQIPSVILLKVKGGTQDQKGLALLRTLKEQFPHIPLLTLAEQDSLSHRIEAGNFGSERYMVQPVTATQVLETITQLLPPSNSIEANVIIVDDDPTMLTALKNLLHPWGLKITGLTEPSHFWEVVTQTHPDLLLLDIEMPTFNGIELCRVVRQDANYSDLPILVVTGHTEIEYIQQAFEAGADDLIRKPIVPPELVARVLGRLERSRLRQQLDDLRRQQSQDWQEKAKIDPLTKIANRLTFDEFLQQQWQYHAQEHQHLSLIFCDVDFFKAYNDCYGHLAGDMCLRQIARILKESVQPNRDLPARYGGEEFALILPNTDLKGALQVAERIQHTLAQVQIPHSASCVSQFVTLSIGITGTVPTEGHRLQNLVNTADQALYAAKKAGRNTYCLYPCLK